MRQKPIVGLNCSLRHSSAAGAQESFILEYYYDSVSAAGGLPLLLPPLREEQDVREAVGMLDALVLIGGNDMNPARYGQAKHPKARLLEARREEFDFVLAREALGKLPILAICGGCQLVNVALGGSLHQHLQDVYGPGIEHARSEELRRKGGESMHEARIEKGSLLHELLGVETLQVNSSHHQSADRIADALRVSARAGDGVVEALEWAERRGRPFMLAVQWHPERMQGAGQHAALFEALVRASVQDEPKRRKGRGESQAKDKGMRIKDE